MDRALEFAPACHRFKILKAECLAMLGRYPEAQSVARYALDQFCVEQADSATQCGPMGRSVGADEAFLKLKAKNDTTFENPQHI